MRLALAMAGLAVLPVLFLGLTAIRTAADRAEQTTEDRLEVQATMQADLLGRWLTDQARLLQAYPSMFGDEFVGRMDASSQTAFLRLVYQGLPAAQLVGLLDGNGAATIDVVSDPRDPIDPIRLLGTLPLLEEVVARPDVVHLGRAVRTEGSDVPTVTLAVVAGQGATLAEQRILAATLSLELASDLMEQVSDDHAVALIDADGVPLIGGQHALIEPEHLTPLMGTRSVVSTLPVADFGKAALAPVPDTTWSLVVAKSATSVFLPASDIWRRTVPSVLLAAAGALGLALVVASSVVNPVERLRSAVLQVAEGAFSARAAVRRTDEIGDLARAFDHMASRLQSNQQEITAQREEIERFNLELQDRVEERTRELRQAQDQLVRSGQLAAVAELGAGLAHDLNNPLMGVLGIAQLLRTRLPDDAMVRDLEDQAQRCREVVDTLMRVNTLQDGASEAPVVSLNVVLGQVSELVDAAFQQRGVALEVPRSAERLDVRADPADCSRLLAQVRGGVRAGLDEGATVRVEASRAGADVVVTVRADRPVAADLDRRDDWMASGHRLWVARQWVARAGGSLESVDDGTAWRLVLKGA